MCICPPWTHTPAINMHMLTLLWSVCVCPSYIQLDPPSTFHWSMENLRTPLNSLPARSADPEEVAPKKDKASRGPFATFPYKRISSVRLCIHQGHSNGTFGREGCIKLIIERDWFFLVRDALPICVIYSILIGCLSLIMSFWSSKVPRGQRQDHYEKEGKE